MEYGDSGLSSFIILALMVVPSYVVISGFIISVLSLVISTFAVSVVFRAIVGGDFRAIVGGNFRLCRRWYAWTLPFR
ncbi:hypothetical protein F8M41_016700 [Gigaspora margarita]|uniref:Uncharacterized protein n=1 Tax=Gigaspora margarita TaxID=4874 RepID=A0A8H4EMP8_GIGMA|nr:hypothetical protein F8M41_016700 [Gigaspora margarita]